jgi:hypothetical protein
MRLPRLRFGVRALAAVVAVVAIGLAVVPGLVRRYHVNRAVEFILTEGPDDQQRMDPLHARRQDALLFLLSERRRVGEQLLQTVRFSRDDARGINAVRTLRTMCKHRVSFQFRREYLDHLLATATQYKLSVLVQVEIIHAIADVAAFTGVDQHQRRLILTEAMKSPPLVIPAWTTLLLQIGGREEVLFVASLGDSHDPAILDVVHNSPLFHSVWPGLLPFIETWLADPAVAPWVMRHAILAHTQAGRDLLVGYATNGSHPLELRRLAIEQLNATVPGTELLLKASIRQENRAALCEVIGENPQAILHATLA